MYLSHFWFAAESGKLCRRFRAAREGSSNPTNIPPSIRSSVRRRRPLLHPIHLTISSTDTSTFLSLLFGYPQQCPQKTRGGLPKEKKLKVSQTYIDVVPKAFPVLPNYRRAQGLNAQKQPRPVSAPVSVFVSALDSIVQACIQSQATYQLEYDEYITSKCQQLTNVRFVQQSNKYRHNGLKPSVSSSGNSTGPQTHSRR